MKCVMILSALLKSSFLFLILFLLIFGLRFLTRLLIVWFLWHSWTVQICCLSFLIAYIWRVNTKRLSWVLGLHLLLLRCVFFWSRYFFVFLILLFFSLFLIFLRNSLRSFLLFLLVILRSFFHLFIRLLNSFILSIIFIIIVLGNFWLLCFCYFFLS